MSDPSNRLMKEDGIEKMQRPADPDNPDAAEFPFELEEARPLSKSLGAYLTAPSRVGDDAGPDIVIERRDNPELTVWISRYSSDENDFYILSGWDWEWEMHFEVPRETAADVLKQASEAHNWLIDIYNDEILDAVIENL